MKNTNPKAPLYFVLGEIGFRPVLNIAKYLPEIQDELRLLGFTEFATHKLHQINISVDSGEQTLDQSERWQFSNLEQDMHIILHTQGVAFQTTNYTGHENFFNGLLEGFSVVESSVKQIGITRIGLRYLDAIQPPADSSVEEFLAEGLQGIKINSNKISGIQQELYLSDLSKSKMQANLILKVYRSASTLGLPPDLATFPTKINSNFLDYPESDHAVIDLDHFVEIPPELESFDRALLLNELHEQIQIGFIKAVSKSALSYWGLSSDVNSFK